MWLEQSGGKVIQTESVQEDLSRVLRFYLDSNGSVVISS